MNSTIPEPAAAPAHILDHPNGTPGLGKAELIDRLINALDREQLRYCHWKSNISLAEALLGQGDLDLLVDRADMQKFEHLLAGLGFKRAVTPTQDSQPAVYHFYGLDRPSGKLIHLHVYYQVITGESLIKNYRLPLEQMLLQNTGLLLGVRVPERAAELVIFVLRSMLKYASLTECWLLRRAGQNPRDELEFLAQGDAARAAEDLLQQWLPAVEVALFRRCLDCLRRGGGAARCFRAARQLRKQLRSCRRFGVWQEMCLRSRILLAAAWNKVRRRRGGKRLAAGGAVIAFVGPDACGKSTLVRETAQWLGKVFQVRTGHLGKPPSTWLTWLPNLAGRLWRWLRPARAEVKSATDSPRRRGLLFRLRAVLLARDRRALARALYRQAANGCLVVCDRYPSAVVGAMDSARLPAPEQGGGFLAGREHRLYRQVPAPDILVQLSTPVEMAVERNRQRQEGGKEHETDAYIQQRHSNVLLPSFPGVRLFKVSTERTREETIQHVRQLIWESL